MPLFTVNIASWDDWGAVYQSIPAFTLLVEHIFARENLPLAEIEHLSPGTNAVFRVGGYVVKIYAPPESGIDQSPDLSTELFATRRAESLGVCAPKLVADGFVEDKYRFAYMIMEFIEGVELVKALDTMTDAEKYTVGQRLRALTDRMNTPCAAFNGIDVVNDPGRHWRWDKFPESFRAERLAYIKSRNYGEMVFVHGDLCGDNILLSPSGELYIIDFADAVLAPRFYEHVLIVFEYARHLPLLRGYFADDTAAGFLDMCYEGLLIHDFGGDMVRDFLGKPAEFRGLDDLREKLPRKIREMGLFPS